MMRDAIAWVTPSPGVEAGLVGPRPIVCPHEEQVCVSLRSGGTLSGIIDIEMSSALDRTSDFIAGSDDFFLLRTTDGPHLVH